MMKFWMILAVAIIALLYGAWDIYRPAPSGITKAPIHQAAQKTADVPSPDFSFTDINGTSYQLSDFKGQNKTIILNFWATWCAPCIVEFPDLLKIANARQDDVIFIGLSVDSNPALIAPFFKRFSADIRPLVHLDNVIIAHDPHKQISQDLFQTVKYPETYVISPDLKIVRKIAGALTQDDIQSLLQPSNLTDK